MSGSIPSVRDHFLTPEQRRLFDALSDQAAVAIERVNLVEDVESAMRAAEADRLRQALLTSISHDLRTPLAAIIGSAGTLRDFPDDLNEEARATSSPPSSLNWNG